MLVNEIFTSIDGEVNKWGQGSISTFIRLQGCNLDCDYCDTPRAKAVSVSNPSSMFLSEILREVEYRKVKKVTITGGEPLIQRDIFNLIDALLEAGYLISVETNGTIPIPRLYIRDEICWCVDFKIDEGEKMNVSWRILSETDYVKFLITPTNAFDTLDTIRGLRGGGCKANMAVGTVGGKGGKWLLELLLEHKFLDIKINTQLHKLINVK